MMRMVVVDAAATGTSRGAIMFTSATAGDIAPAGVFTIDRNGDTNSTSDTTDAVIDFQDNTDVPTVTMYDNDGLCEIVDVNDADQPVTFTEAGANTGVFINWDEALTTNMVINENAPRGTQAVFNYDGVAYGVLHNPTFGTIAYDTSGIGSEWNSGEVVNVEVFDPDMNLDTRS